MLYKRNFYEIRKNEEIFEQLKKEQQSVGYYSLPFQDLSEIKTYASSIKQDIIFVIGIGGSTLGTRAIYKFLKTSRNFKKRLFFLDTIDPLELNYIISQSDINKSHFVIISKSGNTIEPIAIIKYISNKIILDSSNTTVICGKSTPLEQYAKKNKIRTFIINENIGGRFSVFSPVGIVPLEIIGIDTSKLLEGCKSVHNSFFNKEYFYDHIINKARFLVENKSRFVNNIIFSYSSVFSDFNKWYVQLWAESLGKINKNGTRQGLTPIALLGPGDQHSFLQLIIEGVRNKTVTFFKIDNLKDNTVIPEDQNLDILDSNYINGKKFNDLINFQADSTFEAIMQENDIPCDIVTIDTVDEFNIAALMYRFQLMVSSVGAFLQINPYDQPGVEKGKKILREKLLKI